MLSHPNNYGNGFAERAPANSSPIGREFKVHPSQPMGEKFADARSAKPFSKVHSYLDGIIEVKRNIHVLGCVLLVE